MEGVSEMSGMTELEMTSLLIRLEERVKSMAENVGQLHHVLLEGNGSPALTVQVATMNERIETLEEAGKDYRIPRHVWIGIIVSALIGLLGIIVTIKNAI